MPDLVSWGPLKPGETNLGWLRPAEAIWDQFRLTEASWSVNCLQLFYIWMQWASNRQSVGIVGYTFSFLNWENNAPEYLFVDEYCGCWVTSLCHESILSVRVADDMEKPTWNQRITKLGSEANERIKNSGRSFCQICSIDLFRRAEREGGRTDDKRLQL